MPQADGLTRVVAQTRAIVRARPSDEPSTAGRSAVAEIAFRARFEPSVPVGDQLSVDDIIPIDWSETGAPDIVVRTNDVGFDNDVRTAMLDLMTDAAFIPIGALISIGARGAVVCTVPRMGTTASVTLALDMGSGGGSATAIDNVLQNDWAIGLGRDFIVARLVEALTTRFGAMPPPLGADPVEVDVRSICLLQGLYGCVVSAIRRILLERLEIDLAPGRLVLQGRLTQVTDYPGYPEVAADWSTDITFDVDTSGVVRPQVGTPTVTLSGPLAGFVDFLSGGQFEQAVKDAIISVLQPSISELGPLEALDALIGSLASTGSMLLRPVAVDVRADGIVLHGVVDARPQQAAPVASATVLAQPANARAVLLGAAGSWSPGGDIAEVRWEPGDAALISNAGIDCRLAVEHVYADAGVYTACLEITDAGGRVSRQCERVEVGILRHRLVSPQSSERSSAWEVCAEPGGTVSVDVAVTGTQTNIPGVNVTVTGGNWSKTARTDAAGIAKIDVDVDVVRASPAPGGSAPLFSFGGVDVEVAAPNWVGGRSRVWLVDCAARGAFVQEALETRERWLERLAGYSELDRIRDELHRTPTLPTEPGVPTVPPGMDGVPYDRSGLRDPRYAEAAGIGAKLALLDQLTTFVAYGSSDRFALQFLGLGENADPDAALERLADLWSQLGRAGKDFQREYRELPRDRPQ